MVIIQIKPFQLHEMEEKESVNETLNENKETPNRSTPYFSAMFEDQELDFGIGRTFMTPNEDALLLLSRTPGYGITPIQNETKTTETVDEADEDDIFFIADFADRKEVRPLSLHYAASSTKIFHPSLM